MMERIIAIDVGKLFTGIAIADIDVGSDWNQKQMDIQMMKVVEATDYANMKDQLSNLICKRLIKFAKNYNGVSKVVIERLFHFSNKKTYMYHNWPLLKIHKYIRELFEKENIKVISLYPSQKFRVSSGTNKKRKLCSVDTAKMLLEKNDFLWTKIFNDYPRNHDLADCLLMIEYMRLHKGKPVSKRSPNS
jgi:hypothetical protein